jgi:hypothetical protein
MSDGSGTAKGRNGRLAIPMPFDDAIKAALEVKPKGKAGNGKPAGKPRKQPAKRAGR